MDIAERTLQLKEDFDSVYDAGKKAENDRFWDDITNNGTRTSYQYGFARWGNEYIRPNIQIRISERLNYQHMFYECPNLKKVEAEYFYFNLPSSVSQTERDYGHRSLFDGCSKLEEVEDLNLRAAIYYRTWYGCVSLRKIAVIRSLKETVYTNPFANCTSLTDVTFEGFIGTNISFSASPLSVASLKSLISCLYDYSGGTEYGTTLTLKASAFAELEAEGATAEYNGLPCTWAEYIDNKKWNLTLS